MKKKVRFSDLDLGDSFEWGGKTLKKDGNRTATGISPRASFVFSIRDMVTIEVPDTDDSDDYLVPGIGYIGSAAPSSQDAIDPQDLYDTYFNGIHGSTNTATPSQPLSKDKCN